MIYCKGFVERRRISCECLNCSSPPPLSLQGVIRAVITTDDSYEVSPILSSIHMPHSFFGGLRSPLPQHCRAWYLTWACHRRATEDSKVVPRGGHPVVITGPRPNFFFSQPFHPASSLWRRGCRRISKQTTPKPRPATAKWN